MAERYGVSKRYLCQISGKRVNNKFARIDAEVTKL